MEAVKFLTQQEFNQLDGKEVMLSISNWTNLRTFEKYTIQGDKLLSNGKAIQTIAVEHQGIVQMQGLYSDNTPFYFDLMICEDESVLKTRTDLPEARWNPSWHIHQEQYNDLCQRLNVTP